MIIPDPTFYLTLKVCPSKTITESTVIWFFYAMWNQRRLVEASIQKFPDSTGTLIHNAKNLITLCPALRLIHQELIYLANLPFKEQSAPGVNSTARVIKSRVGYGTTSEKRPVLQR
jgi:hypothetical protein